MCDLLMPPRLIDLRRADDHRDVVHRAVQTLVEGGLVVFPTETVYGVGASARSELGVQKIFDAKGRSQEVPLALAVKSAEEALDYIPHPGRVAERLARRCWPGPVTLVMDYSPSTGQNAGGLLEQLPTKVQKVICPQGTVGFRVPANETLLAILQILAGPIALTSANRSGEQPATTAQEAIASLGESVDLVLDQGPCHYGQASTVVHAGDEGFRCLREGVVSEAALERLSSMIILLVCTGNTCRSPMAEVVARKLAAEKLGCQPAELEQKGVLITSAGIAAAPGCGPSAEAVAVMQEQRLDLTQHCSQPLTEKLVRHADVIFTMTDGHRQAILRRWPESAGRTQTLSADSSDISDPIGGPISVYRECAQQIESALRERFEKLQLK